jgi:bacillithiol system protein YtxJ
MQGFRQLESAEQISQLLEDSLHRPQIIFKHSTRCSISSMALARFAGNTDQISVTGTLWYLDLIRFRNLSNQIADTFQIQHESPQVLVVVAGNCIYHSSHLDIRPDEISALEIFRKTE